MVSVTDLEKEDGVEGSPPVDFVSVPVLENPVLVDEVPTPVVVADAW